jgi:hypothetical protein
MKWCIREILKYLELSKDENTKFQNVWDEIKVTFKGKFYSIKSLKQKEREVSN